MEVALQLAAVGIVKIVKAVEGYERLVVVYRAQKIEVVACNLLTLYVVGVSSEEGGKRRCRRC